MKITAIIPAAGSGSRYSKNKNKLLEDINGVSVIVRTLRTVASVEKIEDIIICTSKDLIEDIKFLVQENALNKVKSIILGGKTRQESVYFGLKEAVKTSNPDFVLIHDGARPLVTKEIIENSIKTAFEKGASIVAVPAKDTIKKVNPETGEIIETPDRKELWNVQTPQVFKFEQLISAHEKFAGQEFTDDSALIEKSGLPVFVTEGSYKNIKITTREDLALARIF